MLARHDFLSAGMGALAVTGYCVMRGQDLGTALWITAAATVGEYSSRAAAAAARRAACCTQTAAAPGAALFDGSTQQLPASDPLPSLSAPFYLLQWPLLWRTCSPRTSEALIRGRLV